MLMYNKINLESQSLYSNRKSILRVNPFTVTERKNRQKHTDNNKQKQSSSSVQDMVGVGGKVMTCQSSLCPRKRKQNVLPNTGCLLLDSWVMLNRQQ
jgi:hypothetical protein